jgi:hypothetical protein
MGFIHPFKIKDIISMTEEKYNKYLFMLCLVDDDPAINFNVLAHYSLDQEMKLKKIILEALSAIFRESVKFYAKRRIFYLGDLSENRIISEDNYPIIRDIIKKQIVLKK